ncbi:MAG: segregation/condensation protein A [Ruminiclostridium sp.]|nr:segregation/condensation protein A [Ruminiclostridium sp.]
MEELNFKLEIFEGPLDLMLSLISKHKLNIRDIEISVLLDQFLDYLDKMQEADIDVAGEFVEMAAHLIFIKTAELLPKHDVEQLKKELSGRLIEYAMCKAAAERLRRHYCGDSVFVRDPLELPVDATYKLRHDRYELLECYTAVSTKTEKLKRDAKQVFKPIVAQTYVSVFSRLILVVRKLHTGERVQVRGLYKGQTRSAQVAIFLALLELSKRGRVEFSDDSEYIVMTRPKPEGYEEGAASEETTEVSGE